MAEEKELTPPAEGEKMRPVDVILSMLTYGSKEDWELGMEKMKRRPFLEEDMEKVLKVISDEATSAKGKSKAEVDLAKWSEGLAATVTKVKKLAEEKHTSLYQATELLKISRSPFEFVCNTLKSSFTLRDECGQRMKAFDDTFKKMITQRQSDDVDEPEVGLEECLEILRAAIKEAERDRRVFEQWKSKGSKEASGQDNSQEEMTEIVSSEKTELDVIKSYCEKDVRKIRDGVEKLRGDLKEDNAKREDKIRQLNRELAVNRERQAELQQELKQLRQQEKKLEAGVEEQKLEQEHAEEDVKQSEHTVGNTQKDIEQLLAKTETSLTIIQEMGAVAKEILDRAEREQEKLNQDTVSFNIATLRQLRRALLVEMTVRQQHIDDRNDVIKDSQARLTEMEKDLKEARKKNFKSKMADISQQKERYTREKDEAAEEVKAFEARMGELQARLEEVDASLKELDPRTPLSSFGNLYKAFQAKYDKAFDDGCEGITFVAEDA